MASALDDPRLLATIWNWLPAFRAVAETQHLPTAGKQLHVSVSALSRTIGLLEDSCGRPLFNRSGRHLVLNTAGVALLQAVQEAMRRMQHGIGHLAQEPMSGPLRIASIGVLTNYYVLPATLALKAEHPKLVPVLANQRPTEANPLLVQDRIDVAFYYDALARDDLVIEQLGHATAALYCGRGHPLFARRRLTLDDVLAHEFSIAEVGDRGIPMDGWPIELPRKVGMQISLLLTNLDVVLSGQFIAVLPDVVALPFRKERRLRRLAFDLIPPTDLYVAHRESESPTGRVGRLISAVRTQVEKVDRAVAELR